MSKIIRFWRPPLAHRPRTFHELLHEVMEPTMVVEAMSNLESVLVASPSR